MMIPEQMALAAIFYFLLSTTLLQEKHDIKKVRILISSKKLLMNLAGRKRFQTLLLTKKLPFSTKPLAIYSVTSFNTNSFTCDGKELVKNYLSDNEIIPSRHQLKPTLAKYYKNCSFIRIILCHLMVN